MRRPRRRTAALGPHCETWTPDPTLTLLRDLLLVLLPLAVQVVDHRLGLLEPPGQRLLGDRIFGPEAQPLVIMDDPGVPGGYTMIGESVIYNDPTFVPYKNRPEVRARRESTDIATIP